MKSASPAGRTLVVADTADGPQPVVAVRRYGHGKVAAVLTDSLWRWKLAREASETRIYQRFWDQMISWLSPVEEEIEALGVDVFADRDKMFLGDEIEFSARLAAGLGDAPETAVTCRLTTPDGRVIPFAMGRRHGGTGVLRLCQCNFIDCR